MKKLMIIAMLLGFSAASAQKTNLDRLSEKKRTEYLLDVSKEAIMKYAPGWYREDGGYKIERLEWEDPRHIERKGKVSYIIIRYYDANKESFPSGFSTEVDVNEETGKVTDMGFGDGYGWGGLDYPELFDFVPFKKWTPGQYDIKK